MPRRRRRRCSLQLTRQRRCRQDQPVFLNTNRHGTTLAAPITQADARGGRRGLPPSMHSEVKFEVPAGRAPGSKQGRGRSDVRAMRVSVVVRRVLVSFPSAHHN